MRVGIVVDLLRFQNEKTGIGRYTLRLMHYLSHNADLEIIPISSDGRIDFDFTAKAKMEILNDEIGSNFLHKLRKYPRKVRRLNLDVIHCPGGFPPVYFPITGGRRVLTIHGIGPFMFDQNMIPQFSFGQRLALRFSKHMVDRVITVSNWVKGKLVQFLRVPEEKVEVIYHGVDHRTFRPCSYHEVSEVKRQYDIQWPYILHVSNYAPAKNLLRIIDAFAKVHERGFHDLRLVVAGGGGWKYEEFLKEIGGNRLRHKILLLGPVGDEHLPALYAGAELFVFPSIWETFGLPVLEAMACGTPVVTSNVSALPEIAGDSAVLVSAESVGAIADGMLTVLNDRGLREELRCKGLERAKGFTWQKSASRHLEHYRALSMGR